MASPLSRPLTILIAAEIVAMSLSGCGASPTGARLVPGSAATTTAATRQAAPLGVRQAPNVTITRSPMVRAVVKSPSLENGALPNGMPAPAFIEPAEAKTNLFAEPYRAHAKYSVSNEELQAAGELKDAAEGQMSAQSGNAIVGPVSGSWGLIGAIGAAIVGTGFAGYAVYAGIVGSRDLLFPKDKEQLVRRPDSYGWDYEPVSFAGHDGTLLKGWYVPAACNTRKAVLLLHGHTSNKDRFFQKYAGWLHSDYNLFIYDSRFHGESGGTITTLGYHERKDAALALNQLEARGNDSVGVMGESMGASVAIGLAADRSDIKAVWADCAFDSLHDAVAPRAKLRGYPLPDYVAWSVVKTGSIRAKANIASADPIKVVDKIGPRPLYLVHGADDDDTTPMNSQKLFDKAQEPKTLWFVPGADHAQSWEKAPVEYPQRLKAFFLNAL